MMWMSVGVNECETVLRLNAAMHHVRTPRHRLVGSEYVVADLRLRACFSRGARGSRFGSSIAGFAPGALMGAPRSLRWVDMTAPS